MCKKQLVILLGCSLTALAQADDLIKSPLLNKPLPKNENTIRGQLRARQFTTLSASVSARLTSFPIAQGQRVGKGQTLAVFDCQMERASKEVLEAKLSAAQSKLEVNNQLNLYKNISEIDVILSKSDVTVQQAELNRIQALLNKCSVSAPFSAIVSQKKAQAYQYVKEGEPLLELVDTGNLEIEMVIPSRLLKKLTVGTVFSIRLDEIGQVVKARVDRNVGTIDPVSQTIRVIGTLIAPPLTLLPGMSGEVQFATPVAAPPIAPVIPAAVPPKP
jgi:membrane fusion protein (multidrug efflux system)